MWDLLCKVLNHLENMNFLMKGTILCYEPESDGQSDQGAGSRELPTAPEAPADAPGNLSEQTGRGALGPCGIRTLWAPRLESRAHWSWRQFYPNSGLGLGRGGLSPAACSPQSRPLCSHRNALPRMLCTAYHTAAEAGPVPQTVIEQEVKLSNRTLTASADCPQGAVPEPGQAVEKRPPPGAQGLTSRPRAGSLLANNLASEAPAASSPE